MAGILEDIKVLDLSWGIAGPMTTMLMADHGARVTKIEPPGGDPFRDQLGYKVWQRGKRRAELDLKRAADRDALLALAKEADVLVESFAPGVTERLGIDYDTLQGVNPRLIYCSITGYGRDNAHADRPAYDALVAARTGLQWEQRGWPEGALRHMARLEDPFPEIEVEDEWLQGPAREGPLFPASFWPSLGAFFNASLGINAALRAREHTGRGQRVEATLLQGALAGGFGAWQRAEKIDEPGFDSWILMSRAPKGHFEASDGRWIHNWVPNPRFIMEASKGEQLDATPDLSVQNDPDRFGTEPHEIHVMLHYQPILAEAVARFPARQWVDAAAQAGVTIQGIRSAEESLADPLFLEDGCVVELDDPEHGKLRSVGTTYKLGRHPVAIDTRVAAVGEHNEEVRAEAERLKEAPKPSAGNGKPMRAPLEGIKVLDLGMAVAGPFGCQLLSDLGAEVIKVNGLYDLFWHRVHIAYMCNRGKKAVTLNLKDPRSLEILYKLVAESDVVHHNMRYDAAERLKIDYQSLKKINPKLIYCHTRGFETGPREKLPGNDQTGGCLTGAQYEDGGMHRGGRPMWAYSSMGDTGNGFLSAIGVIQALYDRDRTGEGQFVDTSIVNAGLLNSSYAVARPDGTGLERPKIDGDQLGFSAGHRLYRTADGWVCIVLASEAHWDALLTGMELAELAADERFASDAARKANDAALAERLAERFATASAEAWFARLDAAGVPIEIVSAEFPLRMHDDPEFKKRQWVVSFDHPVVGRLDQIGLGVNLSDTPGGPQGRPLIVGEHTKEILASMGFSEAQMDEMEEQFAIGYPGMPRFPGQ